MHLVTFATPRYESSRRKLIRSFESYERSTHWTFSGHDFRKTQCYRENLSVTAEKRGAGLWLWKPYYILQVLNAVEIGEIVVYLDSGIEVCASISPLIRLVSEKTPIALFKVHERKNSHWTKRDCFVLMDCDRAPYTDTEQTMSGIIVIRKSAESVSMIQRWFEFCKDRRVVSDDPSMCGLPEYEGFIEHRHDQSILNNLRVQAGYPAFADPTQYGDDYRAAATVGVDDYPTILMLHRERLPSWRTAIRLLREDKGRFLRGTVIHVGRLLRRLKVARL